MTGTVQLLTRSMQMLCLRACACCSGCGRLQHASAHWLQLAEHYGQHPPLERPREGTDAREQVPAVFAVLQAPGDTAAAAAMARAGPRADASPRAGLGCCCCRAGAAAGTLGCCWHRVHANTQYVELLLLLLRLLARREASTRVAEDSEGRRRPPNVIRQAAVLCKHWLQAESTPMVESLLPGTVVHSV